MSDLPDPIVIEEKTRKKIFLAAAIAIGFILLSFIIPDNWVSSLRGHKETTPKEIFTSIADFITIVNDRGDIKSGTFKCWPKKGDRVSLSGVLDKIDFGITPASSKITKNTISRDGQHIVKIKTLTRPKKIYLTGEMATQVLPVKFAHNKDGVTHDASALVQFSLVFESQISEEAYNRLMAILKKGATLEIKGKIGLFICPENLSNTVRWYLMNLRLKRIVAKLPPDSKYKEEYTVWNYNFERKLSRNLGYFFNIFGELMRAKGNSVASPDIKELEEEIIEVIKIEINLHEIAGVSVK